MNPVLAYEVESVIDRLLENFKRLLDLAATHGHEAMEKVIAHLCENSDLEQKMALIDSIMGKLEPNKEDESCR